jgi:crossover junction endodeoxyribonuclease RuvC
MKVMGIDPSLNSTGYCVIEKEGEKISILEKGVIKPSSNTISEKLYNLARKIKEIIDIYSPDEVALENVYSSPFKKSSILLALSAGALISAVCERGKPIFQYTTTEIKKAVTGWGRAGKKDVERMVRRFLKIDGGINSDVSDAIAVAICHLFSSSKLRNLK